MGPLVTAEDHDAGFKDVPVKYRRGLAPEGLPETVRVRALSWVELAEINRSLLASTEEQRQRDWPLILLLQSLSEPFNNMDFLNRLRPASVNDLAAVANLLACGAPDEDAKKNEAMDSDSSAPG